MSSSHPLLQMLTDDLSSQVLSEFGRRLPTVHQEAKSRSIDDEIVDEALKSYCFGQTRYTLVQSLFLSVGRECGHDVEVVRCEANGFPIAVMSIGRFHFTVHHGFSGDENRAINSSLIRKQHSTINGEILQPRLFGCTFDEARLRAADNMYANIVYGCRGGASDFATHGFVQIAIPYLRTVRGTERLFYAAWFDYAEVLRLVQDRERGDAAQRRIINVASPRLRRSQES